MTAHQCPTSGKHTYPTRRAARAALTRVQSRGRTENGIYPCPWAAHFHLTHKASRHRERARS